MYRRNRERGHSGDEDEDEETLPTLLPNPSPTAHNEITSASPTVIAEYLASTIQTPAPTSFSSVTSTVSSKTQTAFTITGLSFPLPTKNPDFDADANSSSFSHLEQGAKGGIVMAIILGVVAVVVFTCWFCCGGRAFWARKSAQRSSAVLPLHTADSQASHVGLRPSEGTQQMREVGTEGDAPPRYEEIIPIQHQGGLYHIGSEEDAAVVSDGKTPLSEIPFEDVVLDDHTRPSASNNGTSSLAGRFAAMHHNGRGDTTGHTNS